MKKILMGAIALLLMTTAAQAIRPKRGLIPFKQSDGTTVMVQKEGDRHLAFYVSEDGYVLKENAAGDLCYAEIQSNRISATNIVAHDVNLRSKEENTFVLQKALRPSSDAVRRIEPLGHMSPRRAIHASTADGLGQYGKSSVGATGTIGEYVIPVLMVQFKNLKFTKMTEAKLTRYLNEEGYHDERGAVGSVRDYFLSQSRGIFNPRFEVVGTVTLSQNYSVYGGNDSQGYDKGFLEDYKFVAEAIDSAAKMGVDFSRFARNGKVPNISFFYAGRGEATESSSYSAKNYIWPHMDDLNTTFNDVYFNSYFVGNEIYKDGSLMGMGVFCHEFGHVLGLPDFYCTDYSHDTSPIGDWSIMDYGAYVNDARAPMGYTAYERSYMGWLNIPELKEAARITLSPYDDEEGTPAVLIRNPSDKKEYFIIENHQPGTWYPSSYGSGLKVMRVAYNQSAWDYNTLNNTEDKLRVKLVSANGKTLSSGDSSSQAELWGNASAKKEIPTWTLYNGKTLEGKPLLNITKNTDGTITFSYIKDKFSVLEIGDTIRKDGICYVKTAEEEVTVVADPTTPYVGEVTVPEGFFEDDTDFTVVAVGEGAFAGQDDLQRVSLPATIREISADAFRHTPSLQMIEVAAGNRKYQTTSDGVLFNKNTYLKAQAPRRAIAADAVIFDFAANSWGLPASNNSEPAVGNITEPITVENIKMSSTDGITATRLWEATNGDKDLRVYKNGGSLTFETTDGAVITDIEFTSSQFSMTASEGTLDGKTWTGEAQSVTFTAGGTNKITQVAVVAEASDVAPELIHYPAALGTTYSVPEATEAIRAYAFEGAALESLTLPSSIAFLDDLSLSIPTLTKLTCNMTELPDIAGDPFMGDTGFAGVDKENCELIVPAEAEEDYRSNELWAPFFTNAPVDGISSPERSQTGKTYVFDLQGRKVARAAKGVYIISGKKVVVR